MLGEYEAGILKGVKEDEECERASASLQHEIHDEEEQCPSTSLYMHLLHPGCSFYM